ncbi:c-type cytochrome [Chthonobacter rhizosphaerae]|uniref:c-type cytochrome n=1 Tax=Chthonobacter rhizosphaerae TaxID=2735553 RepID=UPI0015EE981F|nr:cytochrome c family protein [Chthonobacter rhizosphaerae]
MSLEFNKVAAALLGSLVFAMGTGLLADVIYTSEAPEKPGFEVAAAEGEPAGEGAETAAVEPIAVRLASASVENGMKVSKACASCHNFDKGGANKTGPGLWETVNRKPGTHEGYAYSAAMVEFGNTHVWDFEQLDAFLANPKGVVAGTKMGYAGLKKPDDRADLIAYLQSLSDNPVPLPAASEAPAAEIPGETPPNAPAPAPAP